MNKQERREKFRERMQELAKQEEKVGKRLNEVVPDFLDDTIIPLADDLLYEIVMNEELGRKGRAAVIHAVVERLMLILTPVETTGILTSAILEANDIYAQSSNAIAIPVNLEDLLKSFTQRPDNSENPLVE